MITKLIPARQLQIGDVVRSVAFPDEWYPVVTTPELFPHLAPPQVRFSCDHSVGWITIFKRPDELVEVKQ